MIISVVAQKGGVGKTSMAVHLAGAFAEAGTKVLLVDLDPQHSLSSTFIQDVYSLKRTVKDLLLNPDIPVRDVLQHTKFAGIDLIPSTLELGSAEYELLKDAQSRHLLSDKLESVKDDYGLVLIDCPPSLGVFTSVGLTAAEKVLIPLECSSYAVKTTSFVLDLIGKVKKETNPGLSVLGFVINRIDSRRRLEQDYRDVIRQKYGDKVLKTELKDNSKYAEAVALKIPITFYKPKSEQAEAHRELLKEVLHGSLERR
jgi:chromosome partitioning protein